jgi:glycosyltransferase involved in cell wall biosynthesis
MRITHVITRLVVGGAQENTVASVLGLARKTGLSVSLISGPTSGPEGSLESLFQSQPQMLTVIPELVRPLNPWKDLLALKRLAAVLRQQPPTIVHTHSGKAGILGRLAAARARVPVIIHTIHGPSFGAFQGPAANSLFRFAEKRAARMTTHFVVVADAMRRQYLEAGIGAPDQYTTIYSGFDLDPCLTARNDVELRARLGLAPDHLVIGKIARLFRLKGHDDLLEAVPHLVAACPRLRFLLVGDGELRTRLERKARSLGIARHVVFAGLVPPGEVPRFIGVMDIVVHLSLREGLPRALPQALAAGRPVVAYDCDGAREVCIENETGFLIQPRNVRQLRDRLTELAASPALRERLAAKGRELVRRQFGVELMVDRLHQLYLRLADKYR